MFPTPFQLRSRRPAPRSLARLIPLALASTVLGLAACSESTLFDGAVAGEGEGESENQGSNIGFGGAGDFGFVRAILNAGEVPEVDDIDDVGFIAEHQTTLPPADCGQRICAHALVGSMGNMISGSDCTILQVGLNSPLSIEPGDRPPLNLAVAIDTSGSMAGNNRIGFVQQGLARLQNELRDDDQIAIILYSSSAVVALPLTEVAGHRNDIADVANSLRADGATNIHAGLSRAFEELLGAYDVDRQQRVIMLSDGVATSGISDAATIRSMSAAFVSEGITLTTIGVGTDFDLELMRGLAEDGHGNFYFLEDAGAVDEVFTEEVDTFLMPVAYDVDIDITLDPTWSIGDVIGVRSFNLAEDASGGSVHLNAVYFAGRQNPDDVFEGGGRRGGGSMLLLELRPTALTDPRSEVDIGTVGLRFREPGTDPSDPNIVPLSVSVDADLPHSSTSIPATGFFDNTIVERSFVILNIIVGMRSAATAFHAGQADEAASVLEALIASVVDYEDSANNGAGDADIRADIELLELFLTVVETSGGQPDGDVDDDPWPRD